MALLFSRQPFSWFKNYDIYDESVMLCYKVVGSHRGYKANQPITPNATNNIGYEIEVSMNEHYDRYGSFSYLRHLNIYDIDGKFMGQLKYKQFTLNSTIEIYIGNRIAGRIIKKKNFSKPCIKVDLSGWDIFGDWENWNYNIFCRNSGVAQIRKDTLDYNLQNFDIYLINVIDDDEKLMSLLITFAVYSLSKVNKSRIKFWIGVLIFAVVYGLIYYSL